MIEWSEEHQTFQEAMRRFMDAEIAPHLEQFEHGETPPYDVLRKLYATFGIAEMQKARFESLMRKPSGQDRAGGRSEKSNSGAGEMAAMQMILTMELSRYCPGMVSALGVSVALTPGSILSRGTPAQKERWVLPLLTLEKIGDGPSPSPAPDPTPSAG